ncbi:hypothetical protein [Bacillus bingmayongensis]|nr:hypothetical protein [Bacillus bingmayongensis]
MREQVYRSMTKEYDDVILKRKGGEEIAISWCRSMPNNTQQSNI